MIGLDEPMAGSVFIDGDDIVTARRRRARARSCARFGVMYQSGALFGSMTLLENVRLPLEEYTDLDGRRDRPDRADEAGARRPRGSSPATCRRKSRAACRSAPAIARAMALDPIDPVPRRAVGGARSDHVGRARRADPAACRRTWASRSSSSRTSSASIFAIADRVIMLDERTKGIIAEGDPRRCATRATIRGCASSSAAKRPHEPECRP